MKQITFNQLIDLDTAAYPADLLVNLSNLLSDTRFKYTPIAELLDMPIYQGECGFYSLFDYGLNGTTTFNLFANNMAMFNRITSDGKSEDDISAAFVSDVDCLVKDAKCQFMEISGFSIDDAYNDKRKPKGFNVWNSPLIDCSKWEKVGDLHDNITRIIETNGFDGRTRSKLRRVLKSVEAQGLDITISASFRECAMQDWELDMLHRRRRYDQWPHALGQLLWVWADPSAFVMTIKYSDNDLAARCWFSIRNGVIIYNGMQTNQDRPLNNVGNIMFMSLIHYCICQRSPYHSFPQLIEPTCETNPFYSDPSDVYKRQWINCPNTRYGVLAVSSEDATPYKAPFYRDGWHDEGSHVINNFGGSAGEWEMD